MSKPDGLVTDRPSYFDTHRPPVRAHPLPMVGRVAPSAISTSSRVSQPSWSASIQSVNFDRA